MTQNDRAWGKGPSARYEALAEPFRPIFARIRETAVQREIDHVLPADEIRWLIDAGFTRLRVPVADGGFGVTLPELFALLIELSAADPNVTNALRAHFGFTEDLLDSPFAEWRQGWFQRIVSGETVGNATTELVDVKVGSFATRLSEAGDTFRLNGTKFYTTGSLLADWISVAATDDADALVNAVVPRHTLGITVIDDWDGFGQQLTASGTATFSDVVVARDYVNPRREKFKYSPGFFQVVHLATLAGIGRAAAIDVATQVSQRRRVFSHGNTGNVAQDVQVLQIVGRVRGAAYAAGVVALSVAEALQAVFEALQTGDADRAEATNAVAEIEVAQAVTVISNLILDATTLLFDALGASSARRGISLDRHWRNARTLATHNPRIYKDRIVGDYAVNGTLPPAQWRVGLA